MDQAGREHVFEPADTIMLLDATRAWRRARDHGLDVQPCLFTTLSGRGYAMLVPVFASLVQLYEAALGHKLRVGQESASDDENRLIDLLSGVRKRRACLNCAEGIGSALDCAICSARIMLALARPHPERLV